MIGAIIKTIFTGLFGALFGWVGTWLGKRKAVQDDRAQAGEAALQQTRAADAVAQQTRDDAKQEIEDENRKMDAAAATDDDDPLRAGLDQLRATQDRNGPAAS